MYLVDEEGNDVLLPTKYIKDHMKIDDYVTVFIYHDNEGRPIATSLEPLVTVNSFASLEVRQVNKTGCFLEIGVEKDILLPYSEQRSDLREGDYVVVFVYLDIKSGRLVATEKINKYLKEHTDQLHLQDEVEILVFDETPLGYKCVVNNIYSGILYHNELFKEVLIGDQMKAYVKRIRPDGKLDLQIQKVGYKQIDDVSNNILKKIKQNQGFLGLHDKSDPAVISRELGVSKKAFKKAIGFLYKEKLITLEKDGIRLK